LSHSVCWWIMPSWWWKGY
ncbi:acrB/AcrD/AcrF family protein, partial [Vibrio parahaemolyticus V-223/04]